jgi:RNA polymerase sigma-70 factor (ECF subfamily)
MENMAPASSTATIPDEGTLVARLQAGDADAFEVCVRLYCGRLLNVARRILRNDADAYDAVQDTFLSAFKNIGSFKGQAQLGTWLHGIVVNAALGKLRKQQRHPEKSIEELLPHFGEDQHQIDAPVPWKTAPEANLQRQEANDLVRRCIDQLPESYRIVLLLRDIEGMDTEETARVLETTPGVIKTRLHRARQALRTLLDPHFRRGDV